MRITFHIIPRKISIHTWRVVESLTGRKESKTLARLETMLMFFLTQTQSNYDGCVSLRHGRKFIDNRRKMNVRLRIWRAIFINRPCWRWLDQLPPTVQFSALFENLTRGWINFLIEMWKGFNYCHKLLTTQ